MRKAVAAVVSAALLTSGCSLDTVLGSDSGSGSAQLCESLLKAPVQDAEPASTTVLLADGSASAFAKEGSQRQDWADKLSARLPNNGNDVVAIGVFGGAVDWATLKVTPAKSSDPHRTKNDLRDSRDCLVGVLSDAMASAPTKPQTDVLRALAEGAEYVRQFPGTKSLYIATDGLSNTGCADLRAAAIGDMTAIPAVVAACKPELPVLDKDYVVHLVGIGNSAEGWVDVKTPQRAWLVALWKALCEATRATCADPDSAKPGTLRAGDVTLPEDVEVQMPEIRIQPGNPAVLTVPATLLFDLDSADLSAARAQDYLQQVYDFLKQVKYRRVEVAGHTDSTGTPERNRVLSRERAEVVKAKLTGQGFADITAVGYSSTRPACTPEYRGSRPDRLNMACNRRVEIIVYT